MGSESSLMIFDFDGVLVDSIREAALNAFNCISPTFITDLNATPPGYWELYRRNRHLIQPAGDFIPLAAWCSANAATDPTRLLSEDELRAILRAEKTPLTERTAKFFAMRARLFKADRKSWFALHSPCEPLFGFLRAHPDSPLIILTNKNRVAVVELMHHFGIQVSGDDIYAGDGGARKIDNLKQIAARFPDRELSFIDDSILNLIELKQQLGHSLPVTLLHADWGYLGPSDRERAQRFGIRSVSQYETINRITGQKAVE